MKILLLFLMLLSLNSFSYGEKWDIRNLKWGYDPIKVEMVEGNGNNITRKFGKHGILIKFRYKNNKLYKVIYSSYITRTLNKDLNLEFIRNLEKDYGEKRVGFNYEYLWRNLQGRQFMLKKEAPDSGMILSDLLNDKRSDRINKLKYPDMWKSILNDIFIHYWIWEKGNTVVLLDQNKNILTFFNMKEYRKYIAKVKNMIKELRNQSIK